MKTQIINKITTPVFVILALILFSVTNIKAAPGDLDAGFGGGTVYTTIGGFSVSPQTIMAQPDGKILVCGTTYDNGDNEESFFLARYHLNGTPDVTFGTNGIIISSSGVYTGNKIALQPDGKIVAVGFSYVPGNGFAVQRFNANGTPDDSFGSGGLVITRVGIGYEAALSVAVQPDGKIVVAGYSEQQSPDHFTVVRYNTDGSLDTSFNGTGKVINSFGIRFAAYTVLLQPDGKIVAVGSAGNNLTTFALARLNTDGSLDSGFGRGGKVVHTVSSGDSLIRDAALQPDGKIIATGWIDFSGSATRSAIVRYDADGSIDTSFAQNGIFTTEQNFNIGNSIAVQPDGKLAAFGYAGYVTGFAIARLNPNGTPDTSFGTNGRVITPNFRAVGDGAVQLDGKILAVGGGYGTNGIEIVRYLGDSAVPRPAQFDFDGDRRADVSVFRPLERVWYLNRSTQGFSATQFGFSTDKITPADFDGDGKTDISVYRDGVWYWLKSSDNSFNAIQFGLAGDIPQPSDFTGDGRAELAVYRGGVWWMLDLTNYQASAIQFGLSTDKPVAGDYDGDGKADQAIYRGNGEWHLNRSSQGYAVVNFGLAADKLVPADYDGDGKTDVAVYRDGTWWILQSSQGVKTFQWGISTDIPAPADYDGDGKADIAVYRNGTWWIQQSTNGISVQQFGLANDKPIPSVFLP